MSTQILNQFVAFGSLLIAGQGLGVLLLILSGHFERNTPKYILTVFIVINIASFSVDYFNINGIQIPLWLTALYRLEVLEGGLFYLYVKSLVTPQFRLNCKHMLHLWPCVGYLIFPVLPEGYWQSSAVIFLYGTLSLYLIAALSLLPAYKPLIRGHFSLIKQEEPAWLFKLTIIYLLSSIFLFFEKFDYVNQVVSNPDENRFYIANTFIFIINFYLITKGYRQRSDITPVAPLTVKPKYSNSALCPEKCSAGWKKLNDYMNTSEPFLDEKLTLQQLAEDIGLTAHQLSQVLNTASGQTFYDYINARRAEKAGQLLEKNRAMPIIEIGIDAGFSNRTTFYKYFKKHYEKTPLQYRKSLE